MSDETGFSVLRIEVEGVRRTLCQYIGNALAADRAAIEKSVTKHLAAIDIDALVKQAVYVETPRIINDAVKAAIGQAVYESRNAIETTVLARMSKRSRR